MLVPKLTPRHQAVILTVTNRLPEEKRAVFVEHVIAQLQRHQTRSTASGLADDDVTDAIERALRGLQYSRSTFP